MQTYRYDDSRGRGLVISDVGQNAYAVFEEHGLQGGGYTWLGIVSALCQRAIPDVLCSVFYMDAEADNMYLIAQNDGVLDAVEQCVRPVFENAAVLAALVTELDEQIE